MRPIQTVPLFTAVLLWTLCALAAAPETGTWTALVRGDSLQLDVRLQEHRSSQSIPRAAFQGLDIRDGVDTRFQLVREAGTLNFEGRFANGDGVGHYRFEPSATWRQEMTKLGYADLTADEQFQSLLFDLGPARLKGLAELGYSKIPRKQLFEVAIFQVTPEHIRALKEAGLGSLTLEELIQSRIHNVTPAFIQEIRQAGYPRVTFEQLVQLRIHAIDADYIRSLSTGRSPDRKK